MRVSGCPIPHGDCTCLANQCYLAMGFGLQTRTGEENRDSLMPDRIMQLSSGSLLVMDLASAPKPDIN